MKQFNFRGIPVIVLFADEARELGVFNTSNDANTAVPGYPQVYGMRHNGGDWSQPATIERNVLVKRYGIMLSSKLLPLTVDGSGIGLINLHRNEREAIRDAMEGLCQSQ